MSTEKITYLGSDIFDNSVWGEVEWTALNNLYKQDSSKEVKEIQYKSKTSGNIG